MLESIKGSNLYSIINKKCPVCQEGDYYTSNKAYNIREFNKMHINCSHCDHKFEIENGFFYGAMFISYGLSVAIAVALFMGTFVLFPETPYYIYIIIILIGIPLSTPITFRMSRIIWMNIFSSYGKKEIFNK